ncbi:MAG TPA: alpha/beta hydrolase [Ktedonobacteraceae bacterium]|nr:alpha/beta hydrolase [Ktedonobacteraceae bacterium]
MSLDPQVQGLLDTMAATASPPLYSMSVEDARAGLLGMAALGGEPQAVGSVEDRKIPGPESQIPVRIYTPEGTGPFPLLVYFHGGGWVLGNIDSHDAVCRAFTNAAGCITISVDYRLAPEAKFPAAPEDCYAATLWTAENASSINGDATRVAIGGDSAGGNLTAVVALMARDRGGPKLAYQLLIYPVTDHYTLNTPSYQANAEGYFLTKDDMVWFWDLYVSSVDDTKHPHASPLQAQDLSNLPPAMVITAEYDPLRDEGEMYAARLREAGNQVTARRYDGMIHGFVSFSGAVQQGKQAIEDAAAALREAFRNCLPIPE